MSKGNRMSEGTGMSINRERRRFLVGAGAVALGLPTMCDALAQQASGAPYKIGVTYPLSGPAGSWGQLLVPAIEIGVQHVNEAGGINGRPLSLIVEDSKGSPEGAVSAMRKVVQVDGVQVILTIFTNVVSAQMPLAQQFKVPLLSPVEAPGLVARSNHWAFAHSALLLRTLPLIEARWKNMGAKRIFAFYPNTPIAGYGSGLVKAAAERLGAAYEETLFKLGETDYRGLITRAKAFNPDVILVWGHGTPDEGVIIKQTRELGISTPLFVGNANPTSKVYREAGGKTLEGVIYAGFKFDMVAAKKLADPYRAKFGFDPDFAAIEIYDMVNMVAEGIRKNGYDGEGIRSYVAGLKDFKSIGGGTFGMDPDGQSVLPVALYQVKDVEKPLFEEINP
jgi:branched-chain amino acid transport system substrate-binding protein